MTIDGFCGSGSYGTVVSGNYVFQDTIIKVAIKIEIRKGRTADSSPLKNEFFIYHKIAEETSSMTQILANPVPLLNGGNFFGQIQLNKSFVARVLCLEKSEPWLKPLTAKMRLEFTSNSRITQEWCDAVLGIIILVFELHKRNIAHLDIKPEHFLIGPVLVDLGTARDRTCRYKMKQEATSHTGLSSLSTIGRMTYTAASESGAKREIFGPTDKRPGTIVYRPPGPIECFEDALGADCWSLGVIILGPLFNIPKSKALCKTFEENLHKATLDRSFHTFLAFILDQNKDCKSQTAIQAISEQEFENLTECNQTIFHLLKLGFAFLNPTVANRLKPGDALTQFSAFLGGGSSS